MTASDASKGYSYYRDTYPIFTQALEAYMGADSHNGYQKMVDKYQRLGERGLEFRGLKAELELLGKDANECYGFLTTVLNLEFEPGDVHAARNVISGTYSDFMGINDAKIQVREPGLPAADDEDGVDYFDYLKEYTSPTFSRLPGRWGQIKVRTYLGYSFLLTAVSTLITVFLPYFIIDDFGRVGIAVGFVGIAICCVAILAYKGYLDGDKEGGEVDEDAAPKKQSLFGRTKNYLRG